MNCDKALDMISLYIDGQLSAREKKLFEEHIASCSKCKEELEFMQNVINNVNNLDEEKELPKDFHKNLMVKIDSTNTAKKQIDNKIAKLNRFKKYYTAIAAAFAVVVVFGLIKMNNVDMYTSDELHFDLDKETAVEETRNTKQSTESVKGGPKTFSATNESAPMDRDENMNKSESKQDEKADNELPQTDKMVEQSIVPSKDELDFDEDVKADNKESRVGEKTNEEAIEENVSTAPDNSIDETVDEKTTIDSSTRESDRYDYGNDESNNEKGFNWFASSIIIISSIIVLLIPLLIIKNKKNKLNR